VVSRIPGVLAAPIAGIAVLLLMGGVLMGGVLMGGVAAGTPPRGEPLPTADPAVAARVSQVRALQSPLPLPGDRSPRIVLAGDSVAATVAVQLAAEAAARGVTMRTSVHAGCGILRGLPTTIDGVTPPWAAGCDRAAPGWRAQLGRTPGDLVLLLSTWDGSPRLLDGVFVDPRTSEGRAVMVALLQEVVDAVAPVGSGRGVVLIAEAIPTRGVTTGEPSATRVAEARQHRAILREVARADATRVRVVDLGEWLCPAGNPCPELVDGVRARPDDGGHLSPEGATWLAPHLLDALGLTAR
jgi:hypothetical protein